MHDPDAHDPDQLLTADEVAEQLKTTPRYVWKLGRTGVLPRVLLPGGRLVRFRRGDVDAMIRAGRDLGDDAAPATATAPARPRRPGHFTRQGQTAHQTSMRF